MGVCPTSPLVYPSWCPVGGAPTVRSWGPFYYGSIESKYKRSKSLVHINSNRIDLFCTLLITRIYSTAMSCRGFDVRDQLSLFFVDDLVLLASSTVQVPQGTIHLWHPVQDNPVISRNTQHTLQLLGASEMDKKLKTGSWLIFMVHGGNIIIYKTRKLFKIARETETIWILVTW